MSDLIFFPRLAFKFARIVLGFAWGVARLPFILHRLK